MKQQVLIPQDVPEKAKDLLRSIGLTIKMGSGITEEAIITDVRGCVAIVGRTAPLTRAVMQASSQLKVISRYGIGVDNIDVRAAEELGIWVTNAPSANTVTVAVHTMGMIIAVATDMVNACNAMRNGDYTYRNRIMGTDLAGKTLGLLGFGKIGRHVADIAKTAFSMNILAYDPYITPDQMTTNMTLTQDWAEVFARSDFVSVHLPLTDATRGVIGTAEFALMKDSAYFINCARGPVVSEEALVLALQNKQIAGCALDVLEEEPPAPDNPLLSMDNVLLTPHSASFTREAFDRIGEQMTQGIREVLAGLPPTWPVNHPQNPRRDQ